MQQPQALAADASVGVDGTLSALEAVLLSGYISSLLLYFLFLHHRPFVNTISQKSLMKISPNLQIQCSLAQRKTD